MALQSLDRRVIDQAIDWLEAGHTIWFCTVLTTFGSSPREPGTLMVANADGDHLGSLSGGCVEEDFLFRLAAGDYNAPALVIRYGASTNGVENPRVRLPCGGVLEVLTEQIRATRENIEHFQQIRDSLAASKAIVRYVRLGNGNRSLQAGSGTEPAIQWEEHGEEVRIRLAPVAKLILAGYSPVAEVCANFAINLGYQVVLCDPREEVTANLNFPDGVEFIPLLPSLYIANEGACTETTAVVAVTHDPRIDDLAMMAAVKTTAGYIGVMGSLRTSQARAERLRRTGGLSEADIRRIHMPIGLDLGSRTPSEIALSIMADILRVRRGRGIQNIQMDEQTL